MCLIIVCPPGKTPALDTLLDAIVCNPHGSGWMMKIGQSLEIVKSVENIDHVLGTFLAAREANPDIWAVWHSRVATHGKHTDPNCHPFQVPGKTWGMAHNGIINLSDPPNPDQMGIEFWKRDVRSDSRILAEEFLPRWAWEDMIDAKDDWEWWLGNSKVVLLNSDEGAEKPILILNERKGKWYRDDDCWYSHAVSEPPHRNRAEVTAKKARASGDRGSGGRSLNGSSKGTNFWNDLDTQMAEKGYYRNVNGIYCQAETYNDRRAREEAAIRARRTPVGSDDGNGNIIQLGCNTSGAIVIKPPDQASSRIVKDQCIDTTGTEIVTTGRLVRSPVSNQDWQWDDDNKKGGYL